MLVFIHQWLASFSRLMNQAPKKTTNLSVRVDDEFKAELKKALHKFGFSEAFYMRAAAEALIYLSKAKDDLALPIRLLTVQEKQRRGK